MWNQVYDPLRSPVLSTLIAALPLVMLLASPVIAVMTQQRGPAPAGAQGRLLANEVERLWHQTTPRPLRFVGGEVDLPRRVAQERDPRLIRSLR